MFRNTAKVLLLHFSSILPQALKGWMTRTGTSFVGNMAAYERMTLSHVGEDQMRNASPKDLSFQ